MEFDFELQVQAKTDDELIAIYVNPDFYQSEFVAATKAEIVKRKLPITSIEQIKQEKDKVSIAHLSVGKQGSPLYMFICFLLAFLGGIPAIISGYIYGFSKTRGPDGEAYYVYNETTRKMGVAILVIGFAVLLYHLAGRMT